MVDNAIFVDGGKREREREKRERESDLQEKFLSDDIILTV